MQAVPGSGGGLPVVSDGGHRGDRRNWLSGFNLERELRPALGLACAHVHPPAAPGVGSTKRGPNASGPAAPQAGEPDGSPAPPTADRAKQSAPSDDPLPPRRPHGRLRRPCAEAQAAPDDGLQNQRPFHLLPHGRDAEPHRLHRAGVPGEAVDSRTTRPGQAGCRTAPLQQGTKVTDARIGSSAPILLMHAARRTNEERPGGGRQGPVSHDVTGFARSSCGDRAKRAGNLRAAIP
ncbi:MULTISPECIES: DUF6009 family protein [Streptomyces]|uniref:DUF6009 family protein n=1 Tax=Streptomyces TaxID=1883 RepID=UPI001EF32343|nr:MULTISPECIES: DUF6009 family protein [Streptomyces]MEE1728375.1 DUF6009 family protein [Streptomyces sp. BE282]